MYALQGMRGLRRSCDEMGGARVRPGCKDQPCGQRLYRLLRGVHAERNSQSGVWVVKYKQKRLEAAFLWWKSLPDLFPKITKREKFPVISPVCMVLVIGFEPIRPRGREILSLLCLPIPPYPQHKKYAPTAENEGLYAHSSDALKLIAVRKWAKVDSIHRRQCQQIYSLSPLSPLEFAQMSDKQRL